MGVAIEVVMEAGGKNRGVVGGAKIGILATKKIGKSS